MSTYDEWKLRSSADDWAEPDERPTFDPKYERPCEICGDVKCLDDLSPTGLCAECTEIWGTWGT